MDRATAEFWLVVLAAGAAALWLIGLWFVARTRHLGAEPLRGEADVASGAAAAAARLARVLAEARPGSPLQNSVVLGASEREVRWSSTGPFRHSGVVQVKGDTRRAHATWEIQGGRVLQHVALAVVVAGGFVIGTLYWALREFAVPNENPAVRAQVIQMVQAIHLLWPPFLFAGLARKLRTAVGNEVRRVVQNAPFAGARDAAAARP